MLTIPVIRGVPCDPWEGHPLFPSNYDRFYASGPLPVVEVDAPKRKVGKHRAVRGK